MAKKKSKNKRPGGEDLRMDPERRVAPKFDAESVARFPVAERGNMGLRVLDNCAEENIK